MPILTQDAEIGKLSINGWIPIEKIPDSFDLEVLQQYSSIAGQIIENARMRRDIQLRDETEKTILSISQKITNISQKENILSDVVKSICEILKVQICSIFLLNEESGKIVRKQSYAVDKDGEVISQKRFPSEHYKPGKNITGKMYLKSSVVYRNDMKDVISKMNSTTHGKAIIKIIEKYEQNILKEKIRNAIFIPLSVGDKKIGLLRAMNKQRKNDFGDREFDSIDKEMFALLGGQIAVALHNAKIQEERDEYIGDILHTMQRTMQTILDITEGIKDSDSEIREEYKNDLESAINIGKNNLDDFVYMMKLRDLSDTNFQRSELFPILESSFRTFKSQANIDKDYKDVKNIFLDCDPKMLQHAFHNLIDNAIRYSLCEEGISICAIDNIDSIEILIKNISEQIKEHEKLLLFERYHRAEWAKAKTPGAGIGLHSVKKILDLHKSTISIDSIPYRDELFQNTFKVTFFKS